MMSMGVAGDGGKASDMTIMRKLSSDVDQKGTNDGGPGGESPGRWSHSWSHLSWKPPGSPVFKFPPVFDGSSTWEIKTLNSIVER